jgi:hypothetical protein
MPDQNPYRAVFESFGLAVEVRTDDRELLRRLPEALSEWRPAHGAEASASFGVTRAGAISREGSTLAQVKGGRASALNQLAVVLRHRLALHAPDHLFVHAGVISLRGVGIVIPGRSYSGKSTLVAELLRQGATYYSDEFAVVDAEGLIHAYPRPLSLRPASGVAGPVNGPPAVKIGSTPLWAGLIVVTRYERDRIWRPVTGTQAEGAIALLENTVAVRSRPGRTLAMIRQVAGGSRVLTGPRGEAASAAELLLATVCRGEPSPERIPQPAGK